MDHLAASIAKLSQGRKDWYIGREGVQVDDSLGENLYCITGIQGITTYRNGPKRGRV